MSRAALTPYVNSSMILERCLTLSAPIDFDAKINDYRAHHSTLSISKFSTCEHLGSCTDVITYKRIRYVCFMPGLEYSPATAPYPSRVTGP